MNNALVRNILWRIRKATSSHRHYPDFIIIGAQKSGTGSLYSYLRQHPQLVPSSKKEIHFFDGGLLPGVDNYLKGVKWYKAHFPIKIRKTGLFAFEASPLYIFSPLAPKRIYSFSSEIKLIILLRNPTERAISHYFHEKRKGRESLPILEAFEMEEERLKEAIAKNEYKSEPFIRHSYKRRGLYLDQIKRYLEYFAREQILVLNSEEFFSNPGNVLQKVFEFVGVGTDFNVPDLKSRNVAKNKIDVAPEVYDYLDSYFESHNEALFSFLDERFSW